MMDYPIYTLLVLWNFQKVDLDHKYVNKLKRNILLDKVEQSFPSVTSDGIFDSFSLLLVIYSGVNYQARSISA